MSTTGPVTRAMRPTAPAVDSATGAVAVSVILSLSFLDYFLATSASAPPTISEICCVISAWRALFARRV